MVEVTLAFASDDVQSEKVREFDLAALLAVYVRTWLNLDGCYASRRQAAPVRGLALCRSLRNLIEKALGYEERARVGVSCMGGEVLITVDGNGPGIAPTEVDRVFELFAKLETSRSQETGGVRLGHSLARWVARAWRRAGACQLRGGSVGGGVAVAASYGFARAAALP